MAYSQFASLTINHTLCGATDSSNFTTLVSFTASQLADTGHGGFVQHTATRNGITVPTDVIFTTDSAGTSLMKWDIVSWDNTSGAIIAWVLQTTLSASIDGLFYIFVGNSGITTWQGGNQGTAYDSATKVWAHYTNGSVLNVLDWTNNFIGTNHGATAATGTIDGCAAFNQSSNYVSYASMSLGTSSVTLSAWVKTTSSGNNQMIIEHSNVNSAYACFFEGGNIKLRGASGTDNISLTAPTATVWHLLHFTLAPGPSSRYYMDGSNVGGTSSAGSNLVDANSNLNIGSFDGAGYFFGGNIQEAKVANVIRNADWITAEWNSQNTPATFITVGSWTAPPSSLTFPPLLPEMEMHMPYPHVLVRM